ncbi:MAG: GumC family protein [Planctomycetota bacterium]|jgi:capsular exopolysaccharide synthesis family protein
MSAEDRDEYWAETELRRHLRVVRRHTALIMTVFAVIVVAGVVYAHVATPIYQSTAKILIEQQAPRLMDVEEVVQLRATDNKDYYKTQQELVRSRAVLEKAVELPGVRELLLSRKVNPAAMSLAGRVKHMLGRLLGLGSNPSPNSSDAPGSAEGSELPELWRKLGPVVRAEQIKQTQLLCVRARDPDPEGAALLANAVADAFEQYHVSRKAGGSRDAVEFLQGVKVHQQEILRQAESDLEKFREDADMVSLDVTDKTNPVLLRLGRISNELTEVQLNRIGLSAQLKVMRQAVSSGGESVQTSNEALFSLPLVASDPTVMDLRANLVAAERELSSLAEVCGPEHHRVQSTRAGVDLLKQRLREVLSQLSDSIVAQLDTLGNQEEELQKEYDDQNRLALDLARQSVTYDRLASDVERQRRLVAVLDERMGEVSLTGDYAKTNVEVVESALVPSVPFRPNRLLVAVQAVAVGLFLGVCLAFLVEYIDDTIKTPEDLEERVGVPVLGFVPAVDAKGPRPERFARRGKASVLQPGSVATEAYRQIRTNLFFSASAAGSKVLAVTSGGIGDGKTTTATNLALVIAQSGKKVLLVDADLRLPAVHRVFGLRTNVGLSSVLVREAGLSEAVQRARHNGAAIDNLDVLAAGPCPSNPAELLNAESMRSFLAEAREAYDWVIIDTTPVLSVADASIVGAVSDGVVLVVKAGAHSRGMALRARGRLEGVNARILGGLLNDVHLSRLGHYTGYYHRGYQRYYSRPARPYAGRAAPREGEELHPGQEDSEGTT